MTDLLKMVLSLSLSGTLLILVFFLLKPLWKDRLSKQWQYYIWLIVIARLVIPFAPETNLIGTIFQQLETNVTHSEQVIAEAPDMEIDMEQTPMIEITENGAKEERTPATPNPPPVQNTLPLSLYIFLIWLVIALILFVRKITIYQGFVRYIKAGQEPVDEVDILNRFSILLSEAGIQKNIELATNPLISSPLFMGFFCPYIVLPNVVLAETDFCYTIRHELMHYKRRDMFYKWLVQLVMCIHWFNPFVYLMGREINRACELSCDEAVIRHMNAEEKAAYGDTLINAMEIGGNYKDSLASVTLNESKSLLKERLDAIMKFKKTTRLAAATSVILVFALCFGATAAGAYTKALPTNIKESTGNQLQRQDTPVSSPAADRNLALVKKEYALTELNSQDISGVIVDTSADDVSVIRGGDTLKFEYYTSGQNEYSLEREADGGNTRWNLCLMRMDTPSIEEYERSVTITIPYNVNFKTLIVKTKSGNITLEECTASMFLLTETVSGNIQVNHCLAEDSFIAESQSGNVLINGGSVKGFFEVNTQSGKALISETALPVRGTDYGSAKFSTDYGTIMFQPEGSAWDYRYRLNTGEEAQIFVNGKQYKGGGGNINNFSHSQIDVEITNGGSLIVQDLSMGKLSLDTPILRPKTSNPLQMNADNDTLQMSKQEQSSYWTKDDFTIFMKSQEEKYRELLMNGDISQEEFDTYILGDKETLKEIENGVQISKTATGSIENGLGYSEGKNRVQSITIEQIETNTENDKTGITVLFSNPSNETIQDIFIRLKFPDSGNSTGINADFNTKGDTSWGLKSNGKSSFFWPFSHNNAGLFKIAITSYITMDGQSHTISEDNWKWVEFNYPGKDNVKESSDSQELFTSHIDEMQYGKRYYVMNLTAGDPCMVHLSWEGNGALYLVYVDGIGFQDDKEGDIPLSQFSKDNADYFAFEIPNNEAVTFTVPKDGLYVVPVRDKSGGKVAANIVGDVSYYVY